MAVQDYGVVIGAYDHFDRDPTNRFGNLFHAHIFVRAPDATGAPALYNCAVDVKFLNGKVEYAMLSGLDRARFSTLRALSNGSRALGQSASSGALDYLRSGLLAVLTAGGLTPPVWRQNVGGSVLNDLESFLTAWGTIQRIYVFGARFLHPAQTPPQGVHDVHLNQGDPPGPFQALDGVWQDGGIIVERIDRTFDGFFVKFVAQSMNTDEHGLPIQEEQRSHAAVASADSGW
jgi:hypothetical protein